jgi:hypothetical protein
LDTSAEPRFVGLKGWLLVALAWLVIAALGTAIVAVRWFVAGNVVLGLASVAAIGYTVLCIFLIVQKKRLARLLTILLFAAALVLTYLLMMASVKAGVVDTKSQSVRLVSELLLLLYFVFSKRVRQTLVK